MFIGIKFLNPILFSPALRSTGIGGKQGEDCFVLFLLLLAVFLLVQDDATSNASCLPSDGGIKESTL